MKPYQVWGGIGLIVVLILLFRPRPPSPDSGLTDDPMVNAQQAVNRLQEEIELTREQAEVDKRWRTIDALRALYDSIDQLTLPAQAADREKLLHEADDYQAHLEHPPDLMIRRVLLTHSYQWINGNLPPERVVFNDSDAIEGSDFFKDAQWDAVDGFLFVNHVGWAMRLWYDPPERRFEGQLIRDSRLRDAVPGGWIWDPSVAYSVVEVRPMD